MNIIFAVGAIYERTYHDLRKDFLNTTMEEINNQVNFKNNYKVYCVTSGNEPQDLINLVNIENKNRELIGTVVPTNTRGIPNPQIEVAPTNVRLSEFLASTYNYHYNYQPPVSETYNPDNSGDWGSGFTLSFSLVPLQEERDEYLNIFENIAPLEGSSWKYNSKKKCVFIQGDEDKLVTLKNQLEKLFVGSDMKATPPKKLKDRDLLVRLTPDSNTPSITNRYYRSNYV